MLIYTICTNFIYQSFCFISTNSYICTKNKDIMHTIVRDINEFNKYFHQATHHPLVSVANLSDADKSLFAPTDFGMYCVVLMEVDFGELLLKGSRIRYKSGTIFTMKPGDIVSMNLDHSVKPRGWMLAFRPELLNGTGLGRDFYLFNFFDYNVAEALELYDSERRVAQNCFININAELQAPDDEFTSHMLRLGIGQMLTFCRRFYERQFDTRKMHSSEFIKRLDNILASYLSADGNMTKTRGLPTVAWCASQFHLTPSYFGDVIHREIGITAQAYIQNKVIEKSKSLLANDALTINEIAYRLGFDYPNHFSRFFRSKEGITPTVFRRRLK